MKQLDNGVDDTFVSGMRGEVFFALIQKYGRHHRAIAQPILFCVNGDGYTSRGGLWRPSEDLKSTLQVLGESVICSSCAYPSTRLLSSRQVNFLTRGPETGGHLHQVGEGIRLHFSHDLPAVRLHRDFADTQFCADLLV